MDTQQLGPYQIVELIGRGGMAVVYKALQPALNRYVALKALLPQTSRPEAWRTRFAREAEIVARLDHPNILPTYDYGQAGDVPYMVMPLVAGGTLREWLGRDPPLQRKLAVFRQVLDALAYAHAQNPAIVHRDVKPTNVLMSESGWPLLADFGIAKIMEPTGPGSESGTRCGTPEFMAPEQSQGRAVDPRADLYAMGIVLYKLLTGQVPFQGKTPIAIMQRQMQGEIPLPCAVNPALAPAWDDVMRHVLAVNPEERYSSARALDEAVQLAWREQERAGDEAPTVWQPDPAQLYDCAVRAMVQSNWPRVISLSGEILEGEPDHAEAAHLLSQAYKALHRRGPTWRVVAGTGAKEPPPAVLTVRDGAALPRVYVIDADGAILGRSADCDIVLTDNTVSRRHGRITWADGSYVLEDLGSSNGTSVNDEAVRSAPLHNGDVIHLGDQRIEFSQNG